MKNNLQVTGISSWGSRTEIIYGCRNCGTSFRFFGCHELFCHNCGIKNEWDKVPLRISDKLSAIYFSSNYDKQQEIIAELQKKIDEIA